jgi:Flp pilus assembly protein TadD
MQEDSTAQDRRKKEKPVPARASARRGSYIPPAGGCGLRAWNLRDRISPAEGARGRSAFSTAAKIILGLSFIGTVFPGFSLSQSGFAAGLFQSQAASAEKLLQEGLQAYRAHQLSQAVAKLNQAYQLAPTNPKIRLAFALVLYEHDPASVDANHLLESAASQFPDNLELQLKLLDSSLRVKNDAKLPSLLDSLHNAIEGNTRFAFNVVYTLVRYGRLEAAQKQLAEISARLRPKLQGLTEQDLKSPAHRVIRQDAGEVYFIEGMIAASRNDKDEAMRLFQAADGYDFPARDSMQMQMLAEALFRMAEHRLSIQAYEVYLKHFPQDTVARMNLAISCYSNGSWDSARDNLRKVLEQAPQTANLHLYLGLTSLELKNNDEARREFLEELKADSQSYRAMAELAYLAYLDGDNESCREWLDKARPLNPAWVETNKVCGLLHSRLGQFDRAIPCFEQVIRERPGDYRAHYQLSQAYRRIGNEAEARKHADIYDGLIAKEKARQLGDRVPKP